MKWPVLRGGDLVDVVAPGSASQPQVVEAALNYLKSLGLVGRFPAESMTSAVPFHSNSDLNRFLFLKKALLAKDSKAVWCLRGGYGALRLIPFFEKIKKPARSKLLIGYSDITSLHLQLNQKWKWPSLHGPLLENSRAGRIDPRDLDELSAALFGKVTSIQDELFALNSAALKLKKTKSSLTGGNLTVLASHAGTSLAMKAKGKIVILEDLGERGYRVDRFLEQLRQSQAFSGAVAIVFGDFLKGEEADGQDLAPLAIERFAREVKIPCFQGIKAGHGVRNRPWFFATKAQIVGGASPQLIVDTGVQK